MSSLSSSLKKQASSPTPANKDQSITVTTEHATTSAGPGPTKEPAHQPQPTVSAYPLATCNVTVYRMGGAWTGAGWRIGVVYVCVSACVFLSVHQPHSTVSALTIRWVQPHTPTPMVSVCLCVCPCMCVNQCSHESDGSLCTAAYAMGLTRHMPFHMEELCVCTCLCPCMCEPVFACLFRGARVSTRVCAHVCVYVCVCVRAPRLNCYLMLHQPPRTLPPQLAFHPSHSLVLTREGRP